MTTEAILSDETIQKHANIKRNLHYMDKYFSFF